MTRPLGLFVATALAFAPTIGAQTSVATLRSTTSNDGLYSNTIFDGTPPRPYTEVCFVDGAVRSDVHYVSEPTDGGNCLPGDIGWIIERDERPDLVWFDAKMTCLLDEMRLPEPFEWAFSCNRQDELGLHDMTGNIEWGSNSSHMTRNGREPGAPDRLQAGTVGKFDCSTTGAGRIYHSQNQYRCVR